MFPADLVRFWRERVEEARAGKVVDASLSLCADQLAEAIEAQAKWWGEQPSRYREDYADELRKGCDEERKH